MLDRVQSGLLHQRQRWLNERKGLQYDNCAVSVRAQLGVTCGYGTPARLDSNHIGAVHARSCIVAGMRVL